MTKKGTVAPKRYISRENKRKGTGKPSVNNRELSEERKLKAEFEYAQEEEKLNLSAGSPSKVSLKELKLIEYLCKRGWALTFIHEEINKLREENDEPSICYETFVSYKQRFPEYFKKIEDWQKEADKQVVAALYAAAYGSDGRRGGPSVDAQKFILTNRMADEWKEKRVVDIPVLTDKTDEELKEILKKAGLSIAESSELD
jgi:hypothetical protein